MLVAPVACRREVRLRSGSVLVLEYGAFVTWPDVGLVIRARKQGSGGMSPLLTLRDALDLIPGVAAFLVACARIALVRRLRANRGGTP